MRIPGTIEEVERLFLPPATDYLQNIFKQGLIPSHDLSHHLRVWAFARQIMESLQNRGEELPGELITSVLLAALFHDTGMISDMGADHGAAGAVIFRNFIDHHRYINADTEIISDAITRHDDKNYSTGITEPLSVLSILSAADDLDAFGITGVLRYWEIYHLRGITPEQIPGKAIINAEGRMDNFRKIYGMLDHLLLKAEERFRVLVEFFSGMEREKARGKYHMFIADAFNLINNEGMELTSAAGHLLSNSSYHWITADKKQPASVPDML